MKLKSIYIYLALITVALVTLILFSSNDENSTNVDINKSLPKDDVHKSIDMGAQQTPSSANISSKYQEKMANYNEQLNANPNDTLILNEYANFLAAGHKEKEAITYYDKILEIDNKRIDILENISILYFNLGDYREAKKYIAKSLAIDANNTEAIYNLGVVEARIGDLDAAKKQWEDLIANHPNTKMSDMAKESLERLSSK